MRDTRAALERLKRGYEQEELSMFDDDMIGCAEDVTSAHDELLLALDIQGGLPELLDWFEVTAESLNNVLLHHGKDMTEGDRYGRQRTVATALEMIKAMRAMAGIKVEEPDDD